MSKSEASFSDLYWVKPGQFAAGKYPASRYFEEETRHKLQKLIRAGFNTFFDLTIAGEIPSYENLLQEEAGWYEMEVEYRRFPIQEGKAPAVETLILILDALDQALAKGGKVYLHCLGGIGRTGMLVGCYLIRQGTAPQQVLKVIAELRKNMPNNRQRSPDSDEQVRTVLNWSKGK